MSTIWVVRGVGNNNIYTIRSEKIYWYENGIECSHPIYQYPDDFVIKAINKGHWVLIKKNINLINYKPLNKLIIK